MEPNEKKFCPKCGEELEEDALFCTECGAPLPKKENTPQAEAPKAELPAEEPPAMSQKEEMPSEEPPKEETPAEPLKKTASVQETPTAEPATQEKTSQTAAAAVESAPPTASEEKAALSEQQAAPVAPTPVAKPERKFCFRCGASLPMEAVFCNKCGTPQETQPQIQPQPQPTNAQPQFAAAQMGQTPLPNSMNIDTEALKSWLNKGGLSHILLAVSVVLAGSVFMPFASGNGSGSLKLTDISILLSIAVLLIAAGSAYASLRGKYEVPVIAGHSLFVVFLVGVFKYQTAMKWGGFLLFPIILGLIVVGLMAALQREGKALDPNLLGEKWKQIMLQPVKVHTLNIQGVIGAVALALVMICVPLIGSFSGGIIGDKFEGSWCYINAGERPRFIKFKKVDDGKYVFSDCALYIHYDRDSKKYYFTTGAYSGLFSFNIERNPVYEFANEKKNTIINKDIGFVPDAWERYYYDSEKKVLLDRTDKEYLPMGEGSDADKSLKKAYDVLIDDLKKAEKGNLKAALPPFEDYQGATKRILDEKLQEAEKVYIRQTR